MNRLKTIRSPRAELVQGARTLLCPLLLAYPHVFLVGDLINRLVGTGMR
jgi:hypothetical protein